LELKHLKLIFKRSIHRLKFYLYYLLLLVGAGVARAGAARTVGCRSRAAMVACLQATVVAFLAPQLAAALGIF
jgi:hypothetical protein